MSTVVNRYQYFLNSENATFRSLTTPECEFYLNKQLTLQNIQNVFEVYVNKVNLPYTFYQWSDNNNLISFFGSYSGGTPYAGSFLLEPGNYNIVSFMTQINAQLSTVINGLTGGWVSEARLDYVYNSNTNKIKIRLIGNPSLGWTLNFNTSEVLTALGFETLSLSAGGLFQLPLRTVNVNPIMNVYVTSQNFLDESTYDALKGSIDSSSIIAIVPIVHSPLFYQPTDNPVPLRIRLTVDTISSFDFNLIDSKGRTLVMDQPWSLQLTLEEIDIGATNAIGNQFVQQATVLDPLSDLKNQILKESLEEANINVQKRQTNDQAGGRKRPLASESNERNNSNTRETIRPGAKRQATQTTSDSGSGRGSEKV